MIVGFHSPLPPARTGVADYSATLLKFLRVHGEVKLSPSQADVRLYHVANNILHWDIYRRAIAEPGVVVLHDALLQHLFMGALDEKAYVDEFVFNYGEWSRELASDLWQGKASSGLRQAYYQYPMLRRLAERSLAIVVHNPAAARIVRSHAPKTPVVEIPHVYTDPVEGSKHGRPHAAGYVFGMFGYLRESKRVSTALRAFERVRAVRPNTAFLLAGDFVSSDLARSVVVHLQRPGIIRRKRLNEAEFWQTAAATDACINLRYPSAGETSGIAIRMMGMGKPVIVSAGEETERYPDTACLRVDTGLAEEEMLAEYMLSLRILPGFGEAIGRGASEHIRRWHSAERVAGLYWDTLCAFSQRC